MTVRLIGFPLGLKEAILVVFFDVSASLGAHRRVLGSGIGLQHELNLNSLDVVNDFLV